MKPEPSAETENIVPVPFVGHAAGHASAVSRLQTVTAAIELGAGLALLILPSATVVLLVGVPIDAPAALTVARVGGAGLLTLGVASWLARGDTQSRAARGLVVAMVFYNVGVAVILAAAAVHWDLVGVALWPAVILHAAMSVWCVICLSSMAGISDGPGNPVGPANQV